MSIMGCIRVPNLELFLQKLIKGIEKKKELFYSKAHDQNFTKNFNISQMSYFELTQLRVSTWDRKSIDPTAIAQNNCHSSVVVPT